MDLASTDASDISEGWRSIDKRAPKRVGDVWYIVSKRWLSLFRAYISDVQPEATPAPWPGPVNNSEIIDTVQGSETVIHGPATIDTDSPDWRYDVKLDIPSSEYEGLPPDAWTFLTTHFGGGPAIPRMCAKDPSGLVELESPVHVTVLHKQADTGAILIKAPPSLPYSSLLKFSLKCHGLEETESWTLIDVSGDCGINFSDAAAGDRDVTVAEIGIQNEMTLNLRTQPNIVTQPMADTDPEITGEDDCFDTIGPDADVQLSKAVSPTAAEKPLVQRLQLPASQPSLSCFRTADIISEGQQPGFAGLQNLGNTCYMNSALQCLTHCVPVLGVFLSGDFVDDLNFDNPLGKKGEMAQAFGELAQKLWRGNVQHVSPEGFKRVLGRHAAQFQGYEQHDSQEFLSYLLDMLHEDLNRVRNKPYIEEGEDAGRSDEELANDAWASYRARNDSAIVDHFQGLLKSTLDCPNCGHHKRKFDPFMYLSVPLPGANTELRRFILVPMAGESRPQEYCVKLFKHDTVGAFLEAVAQMIGLPASVAFSSLTAVLQKSSYSAYNRDHEYCTLQVLDDTAKELPPERPSYNKEKLLVYQHPEKSAEESCYKLAAIVPPGGTDSLPLLLRVPHTDIAVERVALPSTRVGQSSGYKRLSLRSDCELARRIEGLLTPYKKQRVHTNLVYTPPDVSETDEDAAGAPSSAVADVEMSHSFSDHTMRLSPIVGVASGEQAASSVAIGVPILSANPGVELGEVHPDCNMADGQSDDEAAVKRTANADAEDDLPAGPMDEDCLQPVACGLRGGHAHDSPMASAADGPSPISPRPCGSVEAADTIALPYTQRQDPGGLGADVAGSSVMEADPMEPSKELQDAADREADMAPTQPAVRLLAVQSNGQPLFTQPPISEINFFRLDVRMEDARQVMDVEAMTKVEEHSSLKQLKEHHDYTLEDCIGTYLAEEVLGPADLWHCPKCRTDVRAKKALDVWCLPEVLIIHLKRFSYSGYGYYSTTSSKINNLVTFPLQGLNMTKFVHGSDPLAIYDCFAVSNHMGSVSGGHYTAYCRHEEALIHSTDNTVSPGWHSYNDRHVMPTSTSGVVTPSAYVLFYRRRSSSLKDPKDMLTMCRRNLQQRHQEHTQAGSNCNGVDHVPGGAQFACRDKAMTTSRAGSRADMMADIAELAEDVDEAAPRTAGRDAVDLTSTSLAPLVSGSLPQSGGMPATDTDSQEAVVDFEISPTDALNARDGMYDNTSEKSFGSASFAQVEQSLHHADEWHVRVAQSREGDKRVGNHLCKGRSEQPRCDGHLEGGVGIDLPVKRNEVSDSEPQVEDERIQAGTPNREVHDMSSI